MSETTCTKCLGILGIPSRMKIYSFLRKKGKKTVSDVVDVVNLTQPTVSYHLKEMKDAGLLHSEKVGKEVFYEINKDCVLRKVKFLEEKK